MSRLGLRFWRDERGATAIEYGMIVALITVVLITVWGALATSLKTTFTKAGAALSGGS